jgi:hypothetical protein
MLINRKKSHDCRKENIHHTLFCRICWLIIYCFTSITLVGYLFFYAPLKNCSLYEDVANINVKKKIRKHFIHGEFKLHNYVI